MTAQLLSTAAKNSPPLNAPWNETKQIIRLISAGLALTFIFEFNTIARLQGEMEINIFSESN